MNIPSGKATLWQDARQKTTWMYTASFFPRWEARLRYDAPSVRCPTPHIKSFTADYGRKNPHIQQQNSMTAGGTDHRCPKLKHGKCVYACAHRSTGICLSMWMLEQWMCYCDNIKAKLKISHHNSVSFNWYASISKKKDTWDKPKSDPKCWRQSKGLENNLRTEIHRPQTFQNKEICQQDWFEYSAWRFIWLYRHKRQCPPLAHSAIVREMR